MKVTRIAKSKALSPGKYQRLRELAFRLGRLRKEIWQEYGSLKGIALSHRDIRDQWLAEKRVFDVPARLWKETLRDVFSDILLYRAAAMKRVRQAIYRRYPEKDKRRKAYRKLSGKEWLKDNYLRRIMRKYYRHGKTNVDNQIILDNCCYKSFTFQGKAWISVMSLRKGKRISIPLNTHVTPTGTLRVILKDDFLEVHYSVDAEKVCSSRPCGDETLGIDKGYSEVFVDSAGNSYGDAFGKMLSGESDDLKKKYQARNQLYAIAKNKPHKADHIFRNNLGNKKLKKRRAKYKTQVKDYISQSVHKLVDHAKVIVTEDLTSPIRGHSRGKNQNRRLSAWVKGILATFLNMISHRRGASVVMVNSAYTSQIHYLCGSFGNRKGDVFYCTRCRVVENADHNAARNVLARLYDHEIDRWMPYKRVKSILLKRSLPPDGTAHPGHQLHTADSRH